MLQRGQPSARSRRLVNIAVDMVGSGLLTKKDAVERIEPRRLSSCCFPRVDPKPRSRPLAKACRRHLLRVRWFLCSTRNRGGVGQAARP